MDPDNRVLLQTMLFAKGYYISESNEEKLYSMLFDATGKGDDGVCGPLCSYLLTYLEMKEVKPRAVHLT